MEDKKQAAAKLLEKNLNINTLWETLGILQNEPFYTAKGLEFRYEIRGNEMFVDRKQKSKSITRSSAEIAFGKIQEQIREGATLPVLVTGPKKLGVFGASYLYPVFLELNIIRAK